MGRCVYYWFELDPAAVGREDWVERLMSVPCPLDATGTYTHTHPDLVETYGPEPMELCDKHREIAQLEDSVQRSIDRGEL